MPVGYAIGAIGGSLLGGIFGGSAQSSANKTNIRLNKENRDFQERMSNTSWQRGTKDMLAAGLNPMLAFSQGGANTPSTSAATVDAVTAPSEAIHSAANKALIALQAKQMEANIGLTQTQQSKTAIEAQGQALNNVILGQDASAQSLRYRMEGQNLVPQKLRKEIEKLIADAQLTHQQEEQMQKAMPFFVSLAKSNAKLAENKIPEAEADAKLWQSLEAYATSNGWGAGMISKALLLIKSLLR